MNSYRHDEYQRRQWVQDKLQKRKKVKQILQEAQISRATLYNWIDEFSQQSTGSSRQENTQLLSIAPGFNRGQDGENHSEENAPTHSHRLKLGATSGNPLPEKTLPIHHPATRQRMLLAALEKIDSDKAIAKKLAATLVKRFTLSIAQACDMVGMEVSTYDHKPRKPEVDDHLVQQSIVQLLADDPSRSFEQCYTELRKTHPEWTRKQMKRVYREGRLYLQRRRPRRSGQPEVVSPGFPVRPQRPGAIWNIGAIPSAGGWQVFLLDDVDALLLNTTTLPEAFTVAQLTAFLQKAVEENGKPRRLRIPDKPLFPVKELSRWALQNRLSVLTLSMSKPENELEVQAMETAVKRIAESKMAGLG